MNLGFSQVIFIIVDVALQNVKWHPLANGMHDYFFHTSLVMALGR